MSIEVEHAIHEVVTWRLFSCNGRRERWGGTGEGKGGERNLWDNSCFVIVDEKEGCDGGLVARFFAEIIATGRGRD